MPSPYTREDAERFLAIAATEAAAGEGVALAVTGADDRLIGTIGLMELDGDGLRRDRLLDGRRGPRARADHARGRAPARLGARARSA